MKDTYATIIAPTEYMGSIAGSTDGSEILVLSLEKHNKSLINVKMHEKKL